MNNHQEHLLGAPVLDDERGGWPRAVTMSGGQVNEQETLTGANKQQSPWHGVTDIRSAGRCRCGMQKPGVAWLLGEGRCCRCMRITDRSDYQCGKLMLERRRWR